MTNEEALQLFEQYHSGLQVETTKFMQMMDIVEVALKKQITITPTKSFVTPNIINPLTITEFKCKCNAIVYRNYKFCHQCGQKLDWSVGE